MQQINPLTNFYNQLKFLPLPPCTPPPAPKNSYILHMKSFYKKVVSLNRGHTKYVYENKIICRGLY